MNGKLRFILPILPIVATISVSAQSSSPPAPAPSQASSIVETGRIARFLAGPGDRPQGFLLRNGTFVTLRPGLAQQLPPTIGRNASIRVAGDELSYNGTKTIEARSITVAGVSYEDAGPAGGIPPGIPAAGMPPAAPPPPPGGPGVGPRNALAAPPPPAPCGQDAPAPPSAPAAGRMNPPVPPPPGDAAPATPAPAGGAPVPPAPNTPAAPPPQS